MNTDVVCEQWTPYESLVSFSRIENALRPAQALIDEEIQAILPNIVLGVDGPIIQTVIFLSKSYIGEVRLTEAEAEFDFSLRNSVVNYHVRIGRHEVVRNTAAIEAAKAKGETLPDVDTVAYDKAVIKLQHTTHGLTTTMNYFGNGREDWLKSVSASIPVDVLKLTEVARR